MTDTRTSPHTALVVSSSCGQIALEVLPDRCTIVVVGEIDASVNPDDVERLAQLVRSAGQPVHADLSVVTLFCAEGLSMLALLKAAVPAGHLAGLVTSPAADLTFSVCPAEAFTRN